MSDELQSETSSTPGEMAPSMRILADGDGAWPDLKDKIKAGKTIHHTGAIDIARLAQGTVSGNSSVAIKVDLANGYSLVLETTMALFLSAADAMRVYEEEDKRRNAIQEPIESRPGIILPNNRHGY
jgi:hypothetical protein